MPATRSSRSRPPCGRGSPRPSPSPPRPRPRAGRPSPSGEHTLILAPTGSGKTLAAFLWGLDRLVSTPPPDDKERRTRLLYLSPLRALAVDVEKNLRAPLMGIGLAAERLGVAVPRAHRRHAHRRHARRRAPQAGAQPARPADHHARVALPHAHLGGPRDAARRRGRDRRRDPRAGPHQAGHPPRPQPRAARGPLRAAAPAHRAVGHAAPARRDRPLPRRLPTSPTATRRRRARCTIVDAGIRKPLEIEVVVPVEDMGALGEIVDEPDARAGGGRPGAVAASGRRSTPACSSWSQQHRSTLIFVNARRLAERLATRLNELAARRREPGRRGRGPAAASRATSW